MQIKKAQNHKGFTLIEMIISVGIVGLMMFFIASIFARQVAVQKYTKDVQRNVENAQQALNYTAKVLRTSLVYEASTNKTIYAFDFSQGACVRFAIKSEPDDAGNMLSGLYVTTKAVGLDYDEACSDPSFYHTSSGDLGGVEYETSAEELLFTTGDVTGHFIIQPSKEHDATNVYSTVYDAKIGYATASLTVRNEQETNNTPKTVTVQSTVSLRNYPADLSF